MLKYVEKCLKMLKNGKKFWKTSKNAKKTSKNVIKGKIGKSYKYGKNDKICQKRQKKMTQIDKNYQKRKFNDKRNEEK